MHASLPLVDEQAACSRRRCSPLRVMNFVLAGQFIAVGPATTFALVDGTALTHAHPANSVAEVQGMLGTPVAFVVYVLTGLDDCRGWVTKVDYVRRVPRGGDGGVVVHRDPSALLDGLTFVPLDSEPSPTAGSGGRVPVAACGRAG